MADIDIVCNGMLALSLQKAAHMIVTSRSLLQGLSQVEISAHRALMDGLIIPTILMGGDFRGSLEMARKGYSTRYVGVGRIDDTLSAGLMKAALQTQVHRGERVRNKDWLQVQSVVEPALRACTLWWAAHCGGIVRADEFDEVYRLLGLAVGSHRRLAILRGLQRDGLLSQDRYRIFRRTDHSDDLIDAVCPWWRLFFGINILSPAVFQRFRQVDGPMLAAWNLRVAPDQLRNMHVELSHRVGSQLRGIARPLRDVPPQDRGDYLLVGTFCATYDAGRPLTSPQAMEWTRLLLMGPVADAMSKLGPWEVASEIVKRRFVEQVGANVGLTKGGLYRHIAAKYGVASANTVRGFLNAPTLDGAEAGRGFNRGKLAQTAFRIRCLLAELAPGSVSEAVIKQRYLAAEGAQFVDAALWQSAIRILEEDDLVCRRQTTTGFVLSLRTAGHQLLDVGLHDAEAWVKLFMSRIIPLVQSLGSGQGDSFSSADLWVVPRVAVVGLRDRIYSSLKQWVEIADVSNHTLTEVQQSELGRKTGEFVLVARCMPLLT